VRQEGKGVLEHSAGAREAGMLADEYCSQHHIKLQWLTCQNAERGKLLKLCGAPVMPTMYDDITSSFAGPLGGLPELWLTIAPARMLNGASVTVGSEQHETGSRQPHCRYNN